MIDSDQKVIDQLDYFSDSLKNPKNIKICYEEATKWLKINQAFRFDLVFLDPPFSGSMLSKTLPALYNQINENGFIYVEYDMELDYLFDSIGFEVVLAGKSGAVRYYLVTKK